MGMYDLIEVECFHCGKVTTAQTKQFGCSLKMYKVGNDIDSHDCIMQLKNNCEHCEKPNAIEIKNNKIVAVVDCKNLTCREVPFGGLEEGDN